MYPLCNMPCALLDSSLLTQHLKDAFCAVGFSGATVDLGAGVFNPMQHMLRGLAMAVVDMHRQDSENETPWQVTIPEPEKLSFAADVVREAKWTGPMRHQSVLPVVQAFERGIDGSVGVTLSPLPLEVASGRIWVSWMVDSRLRAGRPEYRHAVARAWARCLFFVWEHAHA